MENCKPFFVIIVLIEFNNKFLSSICRSRAYRSLFSENFHTARGATDVHTSESHPSTFIYRVVTVSFSIDRKRKTVARTLTNTHNIPRATEKKKKNRGAHN